jgi:hypothetical protein
MSVTLQGRRDYALVFVDVQIGGPRAATSLGDDGLIGHPGAADQGATR